MKPLPKLGVGLAFQAPLRPLFERPDGDFDFAEVVPDILWTDLGPGHAPRYIDDDENIAWLAGVARRMPVIPHGIGLSIGSAHGFDTAHVAQLGRWRERLDFAWHSDHLAYHLAEHMNGIANAGITLPLARDRESLDLLVERVAQVQQALPRPFLLENNVYYFDIPHAEMDEASFLNTLAHESGCGLLLDLHNVHTNAVNHGFDAMALLQRLDLAAVGEIHVAGGMEHEGFWLDAHSGPVPEPVWAMLDWVLPRCPNLGGVVFELFGSWVADVGEARVRAEMRRLQALWRRHQGAPVALAA